MSTTAQRDSAPSQGPGQAHRESHHSAAWTRGRLRRDRRLSRAALHLQPPRRSCAPDSLGLAQAIDPVQKTAASRVDVRSRATREAGSAGWAQRDLARIHLSFNELDAWAPLFRPTGTRLALLTRGAADPRVSRPTQPVTAVGAMGSGRGVMSTTAQRDSAAAKAPAEPTGKGTVLPFGSEGLAVSLATILALTSRSARSRSARQSEPVGELEVLDEHDGTEGFGGGKGRSLKFLSP